jgi:hypothetical protein
VDSAVPAAGSVLALNLLRLGDLSGSERLEAAAERLLRGRLGRLGGHPEAHAQLLIALDYVLGPRQQVVIRVSPEQPPPAGFLAQTRGRFLPHAVVLVASGDDPALGRLTGLTAGRNPRDGRATAWLCSGKSCQLPAANPAELGRQLDAAAGRLRPTPARETPAADGE